jgi:hypothetical protein
MEAENEETRKLVGDLRVAMALGYLRAAPPSWTACVERHLERIEELEAQRAQETGASVRAAS